MLVRRVQLEKHRRKARGIVPCLADVCGSRYAQEISMPGSHVRVRTKPDDGRSRCDGALHPGNAVLENEAFLRRNLHPLGSQKKDVRVRLAAVHHRGAEDIAAAEFGHETEQIEAKLDLFQAARRSDAARDVRGAPDELTRTLHLAELQPKPLHDCGFELVGESAWQCSPEIPLDRGQLVEVRLSHVARKRIVEGRWKPEPVMNSARTAFAITSLSAITPSKSKIKARSGIRSLPPAQRLSLKASRMPRPISTALGHQFRMCAQMDGK
jgi:hypothetical protein